MNSAPQAAQRLVHPGLLIVLVSAMVAITSASTSLIIASLPIMVIELQSDPPTVQLALSLFLLAFSIVQLIWGPITDRFGRRPALIAGMILYVAASVGCWLAPDVETLIALRVVQAIGACAAPVAARAAVRDLYDRNAMAQIMAYVGTALAITPVLAPSIGAFMHEMFGWRSNFALMMLFGGAILVAVLTLLPETHPAARRSAAAPGMIISNYRRLLCNPTFLGYSLATSFGFAAFFIVTSTSPFYFMDVVGMSPAEFGLLFGVFAAAFGSGSFAAARLTRHTGIDGMIAIGTALCLASAILLGALVLGGFEGAAVIAGPFCAMSVGIGLLFANCQAGSIAPFPEIAGAASAMTGFMQMALGAVAAIVALRFYDGTAPPVALGVFGATILMAVSYFALAWPRRLARQGDRG